MAAGVVILYFVAITALYVVGCSYLQHSLANRFVSSVNATFICVLAACALADSSSGAVTDGPPMGPLPAVGMGCMCSFLVLDVFLGLVRGFESSPALMLVHHVMGLASELVCLWFGLGGFTAMAVHLAECSTPFLHICWYMRSGHRRTRAFSAMGGVLVLTFAGIRVALPAVLLVRMARPGVRAHWGDHEAVFRFHVGVVLVFWLINCYWFVRLVRAAKSTSAAPPPAAGADDSAPLRSVLVSSRAQVGGSDTDKGRQRLGPLYQRLLD